MTEAETEEEFRIPRFCIAHDTYKCDMPGESCEYLPQPGSKEWEISAGQVLGWHNLESGLQVCVYVMGANLRLCVGNGYMIDRAWCYDRSKLAPIREALTQWDGTEMPPDGWHRDLQTGMRRTDGDPSKEYYNP